jgi:GntR family transcriptional regulator
MQFWFSRQSEISIREQLVTQIILGILSDDLLPGQRLPSTRELARRFRLHQNTISAGYRQLEKQRWVEFRKGSGVYVRENKPDTLPSSLALDQLVLKLFRSARQLGSTLTDLQSRLRYWLELQPPDHFLFIEPDEELRQIVTFEIQSAVNFPVKSCGLKDCAEILANAIPLALPSKAAIVRRTLPLGSDLVSLQVRSIPSSLTRWLPARTDLLVGIASGWPEFLKLARTMLIAAGFPADSLVLRDARKSKWQRGLREVSAVVCDSLTAANLPKTLYTISFPILAESSLKDLKDYAEFVRNPLTRSL